MLDKIRLLLEEEGVIDSTPRLVAVPAPIAVSLEQAAGTAKHGANRLAQHCSQRVPPTLAAPMVRHPIQSLS